MKSRNKSSRTAYETHHDLDKKKAWCAEDIQGVLLRVLVHLAASIANIVTSGGHQVLKDWSPDQSALLITASCNGIARAARVAA